MLHAAARGLIHDMATRIVADIVHEAERLLDTLHA
jgi:hypothetical protein